MKQTLLLLMALLICHAITYARQAFKTPPASPTKIALLQRLTASKPDTGRVHVLIELANYHRLGTKERSQDSVAVYCIPALALARQLKYEEGTLLSAKLLCMSYVTRGQYDNARSLLPQVNQEQQICLLHRIGEGFLYQPGHKKQALDSAYGYLTRALQQARSIGSVKWRHESLIALAKYYYTSGQLEKAKQSFLEIIGDLQQTKELSKEAHIWSEMGKYMPDTDSTLNDQLLAHNTALRLYRQLKDTGNIYSVLEDIASINMYHSNFDTARALFLQVIDLRKRLGRKKLYEDQHALAWIAYSTGNLEEALQWILLMEKNLADNDEKLVGRHYMLMGMLYAEDGQTQQALITMLKIEDKLNDYFPQLMARKVTEQYILSGQADSALIFLEAFEKKYPSGNPDHYASMAAARGDVYSALGNPAVAERYYREMIRWDQQAQQYKAQEMFSNPFNIAGAQAHIKMARFLVGQHRFAEAAPFVQKAGKYSPALSYRFHTANMMRDLHWLQYKVDSAAGNHKAALDHHLQYALLNDSISDAAKLRRFHQLEVEYETAQKNQTIQQRDEQIRDMKEIDRLQRANLRQSTFLRNISILATGVFLVLAVLFYRQYRQKQHANLLVTVQNDQLQHLVSEKEWLLREVHHRVKNNLHTIICLLESQAVFLRDDALRAIESSQHRIYAMSLIHQKLYQVEDVKTIDMSQYLPEFTGYLRQSFDDEGEILFRLDVQPISLDVALAIPVALIVNEAVTNAIKYAFPDGRQGVIDIVMRRNGDDIELMIADNGIGMRKHLPDETHNSLGMELMKGLTREIRGQIKVSSDAGTTIVVRFAADALLRHAA